MGIALEHGIEDAQRAAARLSAVMKDWEAVAPEATSSDKYIVGMILIANDAIHKVLKTVVMMNENQDATVSC